MNVKKTVTRSGSKPVNPIEITNPELIFGIVGPIGTDLESVISSLSAAVAGVGYKPQLIHLTEHMNAASIKKRSGKHLTLIATCL
jgi:hypothetical protein